MDTVTGLTVTQIALLGFLVAGATELISRIRAYDWWVATTILTSAILGGLIGMHYGVDFLDGITVGLAASGAIRLVGSFGRSSTPSPSNVVAQK